MKTDFREFYSRRGKDEKNAGGTICRYDEHGRAHVSLYTRFFSDLTGNFLCTNQMYQDLKKDLLSSIELVSVKRQIVFEIFEPSESDELNREVSIVGFRRFLNANLALEAQRAKNRFILFSIFMLLGVLIVFFLFGIKPSFLSEWAAKCIEIVGTVFVWQFVGYMVYEFQEVRMQIRRLQQMIKAEFCFKKWE